MTFEFCVIPISMSPLIIDMHRQTHKVEATNMRAAKKLINEAFPDGCDLSGNWIVERGTLKEQQP